MLDSGETLARFAAVLHLLGKPAFDQGGQPWQDARLLVRLRNELVHYKSKMASELDRTSLIAALRRQNTAPPTYMPDNMAGWFPHLCLSAPRAAWSVETAVSFLDRFYVYLDVQSPLEHWRNDLVARPATGPANKRTE